MQNKLIAVGYGFFFITGMYLVKALFGIESEPLSGTMLGLFSKLNVLGGILLAALYGMVVTFITKPQEEEPVQKGFLQMKHLIMITAFSLIALGYGVMMLK